MKRALRISTTLGIAVMACGCHFTTPEGRALRLGQYDSICVEDVQLAPEVSEQELAPLVAGYTKVAVLESDKWKLTGDFDLDAFAKYVEKYATTAGTIDGKPVEPSMTREEFLEKHAIASKERKAKLAEAPGTKPITLKILVTELRFPETLEGVAVGTNPRLRCTVDVYAEGQLVGSGDMEAISGIPGVPFHPGSMVGRAAKALMFDEFTRTTILKLVNELADETVDALERAK
jgi:hypothetical protein